MIKSLFATTREIDDADAARDEILAELDIGNSLLKHSVGIVTCFSEFDDTEVLKAVCDALPFDCIGATTCVCSAAGEIDQLMLIVTVLTSDDCRFETAAIPVTQRYEDEINALLGAMLDKNEEKPALMLSYFPLINSISGDMILTAIDAVTGGIPLFGTMAVDHMMDYSTSKTIHNGVAYREAAVLCAIYGAPEYAFEIASLDENKVRRQKAVITESNGNILIGVNGKSALEYLEEIGLTKAELATGLGVIPLTVDHMDGTKPVARAVFALTPEGHAVCGGAMPVNATLCIGRIDREDVLVTTEKTIKPFAREGGVILSYSCMARYLVLGAHNTAEAETVSASVGDTDYLFACSGGEICPLPDADGRLKNYFHNYTIVMCRLS